MFKRFAEKKEQGRLLAQFKKDAMRENNILYEPIMVDYICDMKRHIIDELLALIDQWNSRVSEIEASLEAEIKDAEDKKDYRAKVIVDRKKMPLLEALQSEFYEKFKILEGVATLVNREYTQRTDVVYNEWRTKYQGIFATVGYDGDRASWALHDCEEASKKVREKISKARRDVDAQVTEALKSASQSWMSKISTYNKWSTKGDFFWQAK